MRVKKFADYPIPVPTEGSNNDEVHTGPFWEWYEGYLTSVCWSARRLAVLARAKGRCEECHNAEAEEVHHLTYARVGRERLGDLLALCVPCHGGHHGVFDHTIRGLAEEALQLLHVKDGA